MTKKKQPLKSGEKVLLGIVFVFIGLAVIAYVALEAYRLRAPEPIFATKTHFEFSEEGKLGSVLFRKSRCTSLARISRRASRPAVAWYRMN